MATSYPGGLDAFTNPTASDPLNSATVPHATQHANANDAIEAIEAELGTNPKGSAASVKARFDAIEAAGWVTSTRILDGTIVNADINASAAIAPTKISGTAVVDSDARLTNARTPTAHASTHAAAGSDPITIAQSQVTNLTTDLSAKAPSASPTFTGTVTTPLTTAGYVKTDSGGVLSSSAAIAQADVTNLTTDLSAKAPAASPTFTGTITTPLTTAGYVKTDGSGVLSSSAAIAQADVTNLTSDLAGKVASVDLPYSAVVPAIVQTNAANATVGAFTQEYFAASLFNARAFAGTGQDGYMEWTFFVAAGTYTLRTMWRAATNGGIASISIDGGAALGTTIDTYAAANASNNITDITGIALTAGRHTIRFTGATKNASSTAYAINLHGFALTRTGA